jgi:nitroimidazol reductase NimA-like FMN-containing flavoprotein (pyridoxamine 5'-phosphate oxidase superfamily)
LILYCNSVPSYRTGRTRIRRHPERARYDRDTLYDVLDAAGVAHVAFVDGGQPFCIPMLHARVDDAVYIHGSAASRALRVLAGGAAAALTVTVLDGLVLARSAFQHSANYRSAIVLGRFERVDDDSERWAAYAAFTDKLLPGRWDEVRPPSRKELKATAILRLPIVEASVKMRVGPPSDDDSPDAERDTWAGVLPVESSYGSPRPSPGLREGVELSPSVTRLLASTAAPADRPSDGGARSTSR